MKLARYFLAVVLAAATLTSCSTSKSVDRPVPKQEPSPSHAETARPGQLGSLAAPLASLSVVKGEPVRLEKGKIYVVEFWATWCGPCRASMPHLTEIQKKYDGKGVTVVGVSKEPLDIVKPFVEQAGEQMGYTVAIDPENRVTDGYMKAFERSGIPAAFIVDGTGHVVWVGHPMDGMDEYLEQIVTGTYDMAAYIAKLAADKKRKERARATHQERIAELEAKVAQLDEKIAEAPDNIDLLLERAQVNLGDSFTTELSYSPQRLRLSLRDYKRVLELDPENAHNAAEHVAFFEAWQDQSSQRIDRLSAFVEEYPDSIRMPFAMYSLYYDAQERGDVVRALEYLTIAAGANLEGRFGEFIKQKIVEMEATTNKQRTVPNKQASPD